MDLRWPKARTGYCSSSATVLFVSAVTVLGISSQPARAGGGADCDLTTKIVAADAKDGDKFGSAVAMDGDWAICGAPDRDPGGFIVDSGTAYVFHRVGPDWIQQQKLTPGGLVTFEHLGAAVAISGDTILIGAPGHGLPYALNTGAAYVYHFDGATWKLQQKLLAEDGDASDKFGFKVGLYGDFALVGAPQHENGAVYLFHRNSFNKWEQQQEIAPTGGTYYQGFGRSMAVSGDRALIGAQSSDAAFVFHFDGVNWTQEQEITIPPYAFLEQFGQCVALSGNQALVSSSTPGFEATIGLVYLYHYDGKAWNFEQAMVAGDSAEAVAFGRALALSSDTILIGAAGAGGGAGAAYVFRNDGYSWVQQRKVIPPEAVLGDKFGAVLALEGALAIIGAPGAAVPPLPGHPGAAFFVNLDQQVDCNLNGVADACDISSGTSADANTNAIPDECEGPQCESIHRVLGERYREDFGYAVSLEGDTALVGAPIDREGSLWPGSAFLLGLKNGHWSVEQRLLPAEFDSGEGFGISVQLQGDTALIGAFGGAGEFPIPGAAYAFRRENGQMVQQQKIVADDRATGDLFGYSLALIGDTLIVGAPHNDEAAFHAGAVYVFTFDGNNWIQQQKLLPSDPAKHLHFGQDLAISGDWIIVGTDPYETDADGAAYLFHYDGTSWIQQQKLMLNGGPTEHFGMAVAISETTAAVCGYELPPGGAYHSFVYVYNYNGSRWAQTQQLSPADASHFFRAEEVTISNDTMLIGSPYDRDNGSQSGTAFVFKFDGTAWKEVRKLLAPDGSSGDRFGIATALAGDRCIIGASSDDGYAYNSGTVYIFDGILDADCNGNGAPDYCDIFTGVSQDINHNGIPDECEVAACAADIAPPAGDGTVNVDDLLAVINGWGPCPAPPMACPADIAPSGGSGTVNVDDLLAVINAWGPCP